MLIKRQAKLTLGLLPTAFSGVRVPLTQFVLLSFEEAYTLTSKNETIICNVVQQIEEMLSTQNLYIFHISMKLAPNLGQLGWPRFYLLIFLPETEIF